MPVVLPRLRLRRSRKGVSAFAPRSAVADRLSDFTGPRDDPGNLGARFYLPAGTAAGAPLVVVLHGCTQDAAVYDHGAGWSALADRLGFALLFPEQRRANNPLLCFNWFEPGDAARGKGEAASIAAMIEAFARAHALDRKRVFVTGLSAGGAMASVMLAAYPELFAAGAILAGVPFGCADGVAEAFDCMGGRSRSSGAGLAQAVRSASPHRGGWPRVQVWQGEADRTVVPANADAIVRQWTALHGLGTTPDHTDAVEGHSRRRWLGRSGEALVEHVAIAGMGHGVPLAGGEDALGNAGAHMLDVGLSSTQLIAEFFGIAAPNAARKTGAPVEAAPAPRAAASRGGGPQAVIETALRAAGLMR
jgi:poly(hydroxyalkanoate) depolymerase family esterase